MKYKISKRFSKDIEIIKDKNILKKVRLCLKNIDNAKELCEIENMQPLKGFPGYFRIKFDYRYRIGVF